MAESDIVVNTEELKRAAKLFGELKEQMESSIKKADRTIDPVRRMQGKRVKKHLTEWDDLQKKFMNDLEELVESSKKIDKTSTAFGDVDSAPIN